MEKSSKMLTVPAKTKRQTQEAPRARLQKAMTSQTLYPSQHQKAPSQVTQISVDLTQAQTEEVMMKTKIKTDKKRKRFLEEMPHPTQNPQNTESAPTKTLNQSSHKKSKSTQTD